MVQGLFSALRCERPKDEAMRTFNFETEKQAWK